MLPKRASIYEAVKGLASEDSMTVCVPTTASTLCKPAVARNTFMSPINTNCVRKQKLNYTNTQSDTDTRTPSPNPDLVRVPAAECQQLRGMLATTSGSCKHVIHTCVQSNR